MSKRLPFFPLVVCASFLLWSQANAAWTLLDIGSVGTSGNASYNSGTGVRTINGAGAGTAGGSDALAFVYDSSDADFEMTVKVESLGTANPYGQAGIMVHPQKVCLAR